MGWGLRGLGVVELGLNRVGVAGVRSRKTRAQRGGVGGVRGRKTRASFLPKASLTTRNSQFYLKKYFLGCGVCGGVGGLGLGVAELGLNGVGVTGVRGHKTRAQWGGGCRG